METGIKKDFCSSIMTIPQFGGTCWFNSILMAVLYSQNSRKVLLNICDTWDTENNKFLMICKEILLKYYIYSKEAVLFFNKFKPEVILLNMLNNFENKRLKKRIKKTIRKIGYNEIGAHTYYINSVYKNLGVKCLDITYSEYHDKYFLNLYKFFKSLLFDKTTKELYIDSEIIGNLAVKNEIDEIKEILDDVPDVLIFHSSNKCKVATETIEKCYDIIRNIKSEFEDIYDAEFKNYGNIKIEGLKEHRDEIEFNGRKYKLESCLLSSYNTINPDSTELHAIAGLRCKDKKYIFNSWGIEKTEKTEENKLACPLFEYDWDLNKNEEFIFNNYSCKITTLKEKEKGSFVFNFDNIKNGSLVYIRVNDEKSTKSIDSDKKDYDKMLSLSSSFLEIIKDIHDIKEITDEEQLKTLIKEFDRDFDENEKLSTKRLQEILYKEIKKYFKIANDDLLRSPEIEELRNTKRTLSPKIYELRSTKRTKRGGKSLFSKRILKKYNK